MDVAVLTETHLSSSPEDLLRRLPGVGALWPGARLLSCPGNGHTAGITVLLGPACHALAPTLFRDVDGGGRLLRIDFTIQARPVSLVSVYGPAQVDQRRGFYQDVVRTFLPTDGRPLLLAGDFNCVLRPEDCVYPPGAAPPAVNSRLVGAAELEALMAESALRDIWRNARPTARAYTHWSIPANSGGRLDRWLASDSFLHAFAATCDILPGSSIVTDHLPVTLHIQLRDDAIPRGRGLQGFPLQLLNMPNAFNELANVIAARATVLLADPDDSTIVQRWDAMKELVRKRAWQIFLQHRRARQATAQAAEAEALQARHRLINSQAGTDPAALLSGVRRTAEALRQAWERLLERPYEAAKILDHHFSDTGSFYFHQLAKPPHEPTVLKRLNKPGRAPDAQADTASLDTHAGVARALDYAVSFFSSASPTGLFREHADIDTAAQDELLGAMQRRLPPCYIDLAEGLDGDSLLSTDDIKLALRQVQRGSVPGVDGLPYEFYRAFKDTLVPVLVRVFNAAFQHADNSSPLATLLVGIICLLLKPRQPSDEITSYRPITLLNCDVKLVMLVMANRLQLPLDYLIDITQSAFLRGRDICDNVRYNLGLAARLVELNLPGWLLHSDLTKAYDSVNRGWLSKVMITMGLKDAGIVRWTRILLNGSTAKVRVNGFFTAAFPVTSSLAQGSAASCMHWLLVMQPFISYLNQLVHQGRLPSFPLPNQAAAPAATSFADDNNVIVREPDGVGTQLLKEAHDKFRGAGGPAMSVTKTTMSALNSDGRPSMDATIHSHHQATGFRLQPRDQVPRLLGIPFTADSAAQAREAFGNVGGKIAAAGAVWTPLLLNQTGRVHVARQCLASKPIYQANATVPHPRDLAAMQQGINRFIARSGRKEEETPIPHHLFPNQGIMMLSSRAGGVGLPHLESHFRAMAAKTAWLLFRYTSHPWQVLFRHETALAAGTTRPGLPEGYHWIVTCPSAGDVHNVKSAMLRAALRAFLQLGVRRIQAPTTQDFQSVMLELTFHNVLQGTEAVEMLDVQSDTAKSWLRLRDVREAHLHRQQLTEEERVDLALVLSRLPVTWRAKVEAVTPPDSPWHAWATTGTTATVTLEGPDPLSGNVGLWELWPSGRLQKLQQDQVRPAGPPRPALVTTKPKPQAAWNRADLDFMEAQRQLPREERQEIVEPYLVGLWDSLQLDPRVWGIGGGHDPEVNLLEMTVKQARLQLTDCFLQRHRIPGLREERAAWPKAWSMAPDGEYAVQPESPAGLRRLGELGILGQEEIWRRHTTERNGHIPAGDVDQEAAWFRRDAGLAPSQPRTSNNSQQTMQQPQVLRPGFKLVWRRLCDPTIHRPFKITCWRILHCTLGCNAFLVNGRPHNGLDAQAAMCTAPACAAAGQVETLTHAFMDCPEVRPVIDWLLETWRRLTGQDVPRTARVLLADDPDGWPEAARPNSARAFQLWTRLRVATLGAIWRVRCARDEGGGGVTFAHKAVTMAASSLLEAVKRDWLRTKSDVRELDDGAFCKDWWRGFDVMQSVDGFIEDWASPPILCEVQGPPPATQHAVDSRTLHFRFALDEPVPRPGTAATAQAQQPELPVPAEVVLPAQPHPPDPEPLGSPAAGDTPPGDGCPICYQRLNRRPTATTVCGHEFHVDCLNRWTARTATCPICRRRLPLAADPEGVG